MQIPILIEKVEGNGYRASGGEPLAITAEGGTQEEALANLRKKFQDRLRRGDGCHCAVPRLLRHQWNGTNSDRECGYGRSPRRF